MPVKSKGHVAFDRFDDGSMAWPFDEYFIASNGDLYCAPVSNVIDLDTGNRIGRFEASASQANDRLAMLGIEPS